MKLNNRSDTHVWESIYDMCTDGITYNTTDGMLRAQVGQQFGCIIHRRVSNGLLSQVGNQIWTIKILQCHI